MLSRRPTAPELSEIAARRLELLRTELAQVRPEVPDDSVDPDDPLGPVDVRDSVVPVGLGAPEDPGAPVLVRPAGRHVRRRESAAGWLGDRIPATLQGRIGLGAGHLTVLAALVALAAVLTAWWVIRASSRPVDVVARPGPAAAATDLAAVPDSSALAVTPVGSVPSGSPGPPGEVVVDVAGKVRHPGIETLPAGSRVVDAIEAAGGVRRGVDLTSLNLARVLVDGEQLLVGVAGVPGAAAAAAAAPASAGPGALVNINTADQMALETLPGIGPVTAASILDWRSQNGWFSSVDELLEVSGIGDATLADIAPYVTI